MGETAMVNEERMTVPSAMAALVKTCAKLRWEKVRGEGVRE